jgi:hypothetical protein
VELDDIVVEELVNIVDVVVVVYGMLVVDLQFLVVEP